MIEDCGKKARESGVNYLLALLLLGLPLLAGCPPPPGPDDGGEVPWLTDCNHNLIFWDHGEIRHRALQFKEPVIYPAGDEPRAVASGDFNRDQKPDLAVASHVSESLALFINDGFGTLISPPRATYAIGSDAVAVVAADLNGDGFDDLAVAHQNNEIRIFLNEGASPVTFVASESYAVGEAPASWFISDLVAADFDGDGHVDLAATCWHGGNYRVALLWNEGDGDFEEPQRIEIEGNQPQCLALADVDGDGDSDLAIGADRGRVGLVENRGGRLWGSGAGAFDSTYSFHIGTTGYVEDIVSADFTGDGYPELITANGADNSLALIINAGNGHFGFDLGFDTGATQVIAAEARSHSVAVGDLDGDGFKDLITGGTPLSIMLNRGDLTFEPYRPLDVGEGAKSLLALPLDLRNPLDLVVTNGSDDNMIVLLNDGRISRDCNANRIPDECDLESGTSADCNGNAIPDECDLEPTVDFSPRTYGEPRSPFGYDAGLVTHDFSSDGMVDLLLFNTWNEEVVNRVENNGNLRLFWLPLLWPHYDAFGDIRGVGVAAGDRFVAVANSESNSFTVYRSSGGDWWTSEFDLDPGFLYPTAADLDGDGDSDLIFRCGFDSDRLLLFRNLGPTEFTPILRFERHSELEVSDGISWLTSVNSGDINGDGRAEILVTNASDEVVTICGEFSAIGRVFSFPTCVDFPVGSVPRAVAIGDLNGDYKPDLVVANDYSGQISVLFNRSAGDDVLFDDPEVIDLGISLDDRASERVEHPIAVSLFDVDGDGDNDVMTANWYSSNCSVLRNNGDGSFSSPLLFDAGSMPEAMRAADFDGNGQTDLALANGNGELTLLINRSRPAQSEDDNGNGRPDECEE